MFHKLRGMHDEKTHLTKQMEKEVNTMKSEIRSSRSATAMSHVETSSVQKQKFPRTDSRKVLPSPDRNRKLYYSVVSGCAERKYKLTLTSKSNHHPDMIKKLLKSKLKVRITSLKSLRDGGVMRQAVRMK